MTKYKTVLLKDSLVFFLGLKAIFMGNKSIIKRKKNFYKK